MIQYTQEELHHQGWSQAVLNSLSTEMTAETDLSIGSPAFMRLWNKSRSLMQPKEVLEALVNLIDMPGELTGKLAQNQELVTKISDDLAPDAPFWKALADLVSDVFPEEQLSQSGDLARRVHQLRYIISSHQAQYVRYHFKKNGMTDQEALALYLKDKQRSCFFCQGDYSLKESSRLHNKIAVRDGQVTYPDGYSSANSKVLLGFHTEFILDSQGNFLNETDAEKVTENGIVNGASFNYGTRGKRHWQLDVDPVRRHDPMFRKATNRGFRAPNRSRRWPFLAKGDYELSYFNPKGLYSLNQQSSQKRVKQEMRTFKEMIKMAKRT
ncbi:DUF3114 domain-containing protein [Streptococcus hyovaginalis]